MDSVLREAFVAYARAKPDEEVCALLVAKEGVVVLDVVQNTHHDKTRHFRIARGDLLGKEIVGVIHSHPNTPAIASIADKAGCNESAVPWYVFSLVTQEWATVLPVNEFAPLLGRPFVYGTFDCWTLVRDYYWQTLQIRLPVIEAPYGFWKRGEEPYLTNYPAAGFVDAPHGTLKLHDVILMQYASPTTNHSGVYTGDGLFIHHVEGNLSTQAPYGGYWMEHTRKIVRHHTLC